MKDDLFELAVRACEDVKGPWRATMGNEVRGAGNICVAGIIRTDSLTNYLAAVDPETVVYLLTKLAALEGAAQGILAAEQGALSMMAVKSILRAAMKD